MKCVDCGKEFGERKSVKQVKVNLNNPGVVLFSAKTSECPHCHQHYVDEEDMKDACNAFDAEYQKKHQKK